MSDFAKFCPKCYAFFRDPDLYAKHVEACGFAKNRKRDTEAVKESKKMATKETAGGRKQAAAEKSQEVENGVEQDEVGSKTSDSCFLAPDSSPAACLPTSAVSPKPKFKT